MLPCLTDGELRPREGRASSEVTEASDAREVALQPLSSLVLGSLTKPWSISLCTCEGLWGVQVDRVSQEVI